MCIKKTPFFYVKKSKNPPAGFKRVTTRSEVKAYMYKL